MVKIEKKTLLEGLKSVVRVVPRNNISMNILQGILIECENNNMAITGTDLKMAITTNLICQTEMFSEKYVVDARLFHDIISKMPSGNIEISLLEEGKILGIKGGKSKFNITTLGEPAEFPSFKTEIENTESISLPGNTFREIVRKTVPFSTEDETRPILTGVLFEFTKNKARAVSLDGYRLSHYIAEIENEIEKELVVESDVLVNVSRIAGENVMITFDKEETKSIKFKTGETIIYSRVLEGQFLDYKSILTPTNATTFVKINTDEFRKAIERVVVISKSSLEIRPTVLLIDTKENKLKINAESDIAKVKEVLEVKAEGEDVKIAFNPNFLLEGLKVIETEELELRINGSLKPAFLLDNEDYIHLVLPIRLASHEEDKNDESDGEKIAS